VRRGLVVFEHLDDVMAILLFSHEQEALVVWASPLGLMT
jgi:hypothetical protein